MGLKETAPSVSHLEQGRGMVIGCEGDGPLRLAFGAREGWAVETHSL